MNDHELLQSYLRGGSQAAFAQLVERHVNLVYSAAHRLVRDVHLAQDVTQQVFTLLARKAERLGRDTILSAWLYRAARHVACETVRREGRRHCREQLAAEAMSQSVPDDPWREVQPLLDEAMADLSAADHDAVVLRYFENKSLKEVGEALGSSEDAAQKRVARALDRLRMNLTQRGVTVSVTALAAAVSGGAVQSSPAGLAALTTSASLAAPAAIRLVPKLLQAMAKAKLKLSVAAVAVGAFSITLALLWNQNTSLRHDLAALQPQHPPEANHESSAMGTTNNEWRRLRMEHLELLSLRGRVAQLTRELREAKAPGAQAITSPPDAAPEEKQPDSILFSASLTNRVNSGHTLVAGGWSKQGKRRYLLATAVTRHGDTIPDGQDVTIESRIVGAPESFWEQIGWSAFKSDTRRSTLAAVLTPDQLDTLLMALKETKDANLSNVSLAKRRDGEYLGVAFSMTDDADQKGGVLMAIDVYPRITRDGASVDLELRPSPVPTDIEIHSSLKQTVEPAASKAQ